MGRLGLITSIFFHSTLQNFCRWEKSVKHGFIYQPVKTRIRLRKEVAEITIINNVEHYSVTRKKEVIGRSHGAWFIIRPLLCRPEAKKKYGL